MYFLSSVIFGAFLSCIVVFVAAVIYHQLAVRSRADGRPMGAWMSQHTNDFGVFILAGTITFINILYGY
jgi:hypothetical protein